MTSHVFFVRQKEDLIFLGVGWQDFFHETHWQLAWNSFFWLSLSRMEWRSCSGTFLWLGNSIVIFYYFLGNILSLKWERNTGRSYVNKSPSPNDQISPSSRSLFLFLPLSQQTCQTLPKAQRSQWLCGSKIQISSSESRPSVSYKIATKHQHLDLT